MGDDVKTLRQLLTEFCVEQVDEVIADTTSLAAEQRLRRGFGFELLPLLLVFLAEFFSWKTATQQSTLPILPPKQRHHHYHCYHLPSSSSSSQTYNVHMYSKIKPLCNTKSQLCDEKYYANDIDNFSNMNLTIFPFKYFFTDNSRTYGPFTELFLTVYAL